MFSERKGKKKKSKKLCIFHSSPAKYNFKVNAVLQNPAEKEKWHLPHSSDIMFPSVTSQLLFFPFFAPFTDDLCRSLGLTSVLHKNVPSR